MWLGYPPQTRWFLPSTKYTYQSARLCRPKCDRSFLRLRGLTRSQFGLVDHQPRLTPNFADKHPSVHLFGLCLNDALHNCYDPDQDQQFDCVIGFDKQERDHSEGCKAATSAPE